MTLTSPVELTQIFPQFDDKLIDSLEQVGEVTLAYLSMLFGMAMLNFEVVGDTSRSRFRLLPGGSTYKFQ